MSRHRKWNPDPCVNCVIRLICNRQQEDGSMCEDRFHYYHFKKLLKFKERILFFEYKDALLDEMYHVAYMTCSTDRKFSNENDFSKNYKQTLLKKFTYKR